MTEPYTITRTEATVDARDYVSRYRDVPRITAMCHGCPNYGTLWSCPPHEGDVSGLFDGFTRVTIHGTTITFSEATRRQCADAQQSRAMASRAIEAAWHELLPWLYEQEHSHPGSLMLAGRCRLCRPQPCTRAEGQPCRHPERMRHSLEAIGFDVVKTAHDILGIDLEWSSDGLLTQHITIVTALFDL